MKPSKRILSKGRPYVHMFDAVAHPYRVAILLLLTNKPLREKDLVKKLKITQNLVSHHLTLLHTEGWIIKKRIGVVLYYGIGKKALKILHEFTELVVPTKKF